MPLNSNRGTTKAQWNIIFFTELSGFRICSLIRWVSTSRERLSVFCLDPFIRRSTERRQRDYSEKIKFNRNLILGFVYGISISV